MEANGAGYVLKYFLFTIFTNFTHTLYRFRGNILIKVSMRVNIS